MTWSQENCLIDDHQKNPDEYLFGFCDPRAMGMGILRIHWDTRDSGTDRNRRELNV